MASSLARLLPERFPNDRYVGMVARHSDEAVAAMREQFHLHDLEVVTSQFPRPLLYEGWHWIGMPRFQKVARYLGGIDLVYSPNLAVPPRPKGAALVITAHDAAPVLFPETYPLHGRLFHRRGYALANARADRVITVSNAAREELISHTPIRPEQIEVVPHAVEELESSTTAQEHIRNELHLGTDPVVVWVGTVEPRKNLEMLLRAWSDVIEALPAARLVLIGPTGWGASAGAISKLAPQLGDHLVVAGRRSDEDRNALIAGADLLVMPSIHEGFGLPVLEAMQLGTAVLASDIPALREAAAGAAVHVPPHDVEGWSSEILALLRDPSRREQLVAAGKAVATSRSWEQVADETHAVFERAVSARAARGGTPQK